MLIALLLLKEQDKSGSIDFKQFYMRRGLRLFPALYAVWSPMRSVSFQLCCLGVKERLYLLWPMILSRVSRLKLIYGIVAVIVADLIYREVLVARVHNIYAAFSFDTNLGCILMGCFIALLAHRGIQFPNWMGSTVIPVTGGVLDLLAPPANTTLQPVTVTGKREGFPLSWMLRDWRDSRLSLRARSRLAPWHR